MIFTVRYLESISDVKILLANKYVLLKAMRNADAMLTLLRDKDLRKKFSEAGRERANDFRIEKILPQYEELF